MFSHKAQVIYLFMNWNQQNHMICDDFIMPEQTVMFFSGDAAHTCTAAQPLKNRYTMLKLFNSS
jgi:hypothetical protein